MSYPPAQLALFALKGWQAWYMLHTHCLYIVCGVSGFVGFRTFTDYDFMERNTQGSIQRDVALELLVTIWQSVWVTDERRRIHILIFQSEPIHPLTMELIEDAFAEETEYSTGFYGWHPMGHTYEERS